MGNSPSSSYNSSTLSKSGVRRPKSVSHYLQVSLFLKVQYDLFKGSEDSPKTRAAI